MTYNYKNSLIYSVIAVLSYFLYKMESYLLLNFSPFSLLFAVPDSSNNTPTKVFALTLVLFSFCLNKKSSVICVVRMSENLYYLFFFVGIRRVSCVTSSFILLFQRLHKLWCDRMNKSKQAIGCHVQ